MKFNPEKELVDLSGKVAIVTGSTSGIGFATAQYLFDRGARVYLAARNEEKAKRCIERLESEREAKSGQAVFLSLSLNDPRDVQLSAKKFLELESRLDILVNNAAMIIEHYNVGPLGLQDIVLINHFSPAVLTHALLPLMKQTAATGADVRIVNVSSDSHQLAPTPVRLASKEDFNKSYEGKWFASMKRYGLSKLAFTLWSNELQRRLLESPDPGAKDIIVIALHPGTVFTENTVATANRFPYPLSSVLAFLSKLAMLDVRTGAATSAFAAASPKVREESTKYRGAYLQPVAKIGKCSKLAQDPKLAKECWETTTSLLKEMNIDLAV